jgi:hypothetical protein
MKSVITIIAFAYACSVSAQGTFQNLDFEQASIPPGTRPSPSVPISGALPDWSAYFTSGTTVYPQTSVGYDVLTAGGNNISLVDSSAGYGVGPIQGNYSVMLFSGGDNPYYSASISQTGLVPAGTESLLFDAVGTGVPFIVTLGGQTINMTALQSFPNYTVYGGNIPSAFADQVETLAITEPTTTSRPASILELDDISFSPTAVPEPSPLALTGVVGLLFALCRRFAPKRP